MIRPSAMMLRPICTVLLLALAAGCHGALPPDQAIASLHDPDASVRVRAADSLRTPEGVPADAVPVLLQAIENEEDPNARGAILITLGRSGDPAARPIIDHAVLTASNADEERWARRALKYWRLQNHELEPNAKASYWRP